MRRVAVQSSAELLLRFVEAAQVEQHFSELDMRRGNASAKFHGTFQLLLALRDVLHEHGLRPEICPAAVMGIQLFRLSEGSARLRIETMSVKDHTKLSPGTCGPRRLHD